MADVRRQDVADLYELLEVSPHASSDVIQAAYRVLVRVHHPDRNETAEAAQRTRELNAAYQVLSDPQRRARYDLELVRARRVERMTQPLPRQTAPRVLPARSERSERLAQPRSPMMNAQVMIALIFVAVVFTILLFLVWMSLDGSEPVEIAPPPYAGHQVQFTAP